MARSGDDIKKQGTGTRVLLAVSEIYDWLEIAAFALSIVLLLGTFFIRVATVCGQSMDPTLSDGDVLLVSNLMYEPKPGDIIVFDPPGDTFTDPLVKRVIATEGQTVYIDGEKKEIFVDGVLIDESGYLSSIDSVYPASDISYPYTVEEGTVFVLGDNRGNSLDSRSSEIGAVDVDNILGLVVFRLYPITDFGLIK